jgi:hypothetical protein
MLALRMSAVFPNHDSAERAVKELRKLGVDNDHIAVITKTQPAAAAAGGAAGGLAAGAAVGAIFGLAAAAIPGVGPFITAGWLATSLGALGGGAAAGAIVGGSAGLISGALVNAGYAAKEAEFLSTELEAGRVVVAIDRGAEVTDATVATVFAEHGGRTYMTV